MRLYHGTRGIDPGAIQREGLRPADPEAGLAQALRLAGYRWLSDVPKRWVRRACQREVEYRRSQGSAVHLTLSRRNASLYSRVPTGGEHVGMCLQLLWRHGRRRSPSTQPGQHGQRYVIVVEAPFGALPVSIQNSLLSLWRLGHGDLEGRAWDIQLPAVPPEWIVAVEPIEEVGADKRIRRQGNGKGR